MSIQRYDLYEESEYPWHGSIQEMPDTGDYVLYADHAAEVARLTCRIAGLEGRVQGYQAAICERVAQRDAAVERAERAEEALRRLMAYATDLQAYVCPEVARQEQPYDHPIEIARAYFAAAQDDKHSALEPEPWGGPEGEKPKGGNHAAQSNGPPDPGETN